MEESNSTGKNLQGQQVQEQSGHVQLQEGLLCQLLETGESIDQEDGGQHPRGPGGEGQGRMLVSGGARAGGCCIQIKNHQTLSLQIN